MLYRACLAPSSEYSLPLYKLLPLHQGEDKLSTMSGMSGLLRSAGGLLFLYHLRELLSLQIS